MASKPIEWALSQSDTILGRACSAVLSTMPRSLQPELVNYDIDDLGALVPEWGAADARKPPAPTPQKLDKADTAMPPMAPVA